MWKLVTVLVFILCGAAGAYLGRHSRAGRTGTGVDGAAAAVPGWSSPGEGGQPTWDEPKIYAHLLATLDTFTTARPDIPGALTLIEEACTTCAAPGPGRVEPEWRWWTVPSLPSDRVAIGFARGVEGGHPALRVMLSLLPSAPVSEPYRATGTMLDLKVVEVDSRRQVIGVAAYGVAIPISPFDEPFREPITLNFGHRFRLSDEGQVKLIKYWSEFSYVDGHPTVTSYFGSEAWEFDAPFALNPGIPEKASEWIRRRIPGE